MSQPRYEFEDVCQFLREMLASLPSARHRRFRNTLEVGVLEGRGAELLTAVSDTYTGIDPRPTDWAANNLRLFSETNGCRTRLLRSTSQEVMPQLWLENREYDLIVIDGDHSAEAVRSDAVWASQLVSVGGLIVFDDAEHSGYGRGIKAAAAAVTQQAEGVFVCRRRGYLEVFERV